MLQKVLISSSIVVYEPVKITARQNEEHLLDPQMPKMNR